MQSDFPIPIETRALGTLAYIRRSIDASASMAVPGTAGVVMGICLLAFCSAALAVGKFEMSLGIEELRTLAFTALVFGSQATIYAIRQRRHLWGSRPSLWLAVSSVTDILIASILAVGGIAMTPLPALTIAGTLAAATAFAFVLDMVKVPLFVRLGIA